MRRIVCYDCGKKYDYDVDDFCPRCGAFTQPARHSRIASDGSVVRVEGISEAFHRESFVHAEFHEENRERKGTVLEQSAARSPRSPRKQAASGKQAAVRQITPPLAGAGPVKKEEQGKSLGAGFFIAAALVILKILLDIMA